MNEDWLQPRAAVPVSIEVTEALLKEVIRLRAALKNAEQCADESDCSHTPWCRIRGDCQRAALEQQGQEQEPVAPRREWVGLTADEMVDLQNEYGITTCPREFAAIEAKLKEKNT